MKSASGQGFDVVCFEWLAAHVLARSNEASPDEDGENDRDNNHDHDDSIRESGKSFADDEGDDEVDDGPNNYDESNDDEAACKKRQGEDLSTKREVAPSKSISSKRPSSRSRRQQRKSNQSIAHGRKHSAAAGTEAKNQPLPWKPPSPSPPAHLAPSSPSPPNPRPRSRSPSRIQQQRQSQKVTPSAIAVHEYHLKQQDRLARAAKHRHQSLGDLVRGANDRVAAKDHRDEEIARAEEAAAAAPIVVTRIRSGGYYY